MADTLTTIVQITVAAFTVGTTLATRTLPWLRTKASGRMVTRRLGSTFTTEDVEQAVRYYVEPMCQSVDPAGAEEPGLAFAAREGLFAALDRALHHPTEYRYIFLLADSGMGKSSALINYYARHLRRPRRKFDISIVPLGIHDADARIEAISDKSNTILFLDAFDEDTLAIVDHEERLRILIRSTRDFRRVLITCRTQFFGKDEEIPTRTGVLKVGARSAGEGAEYVFHKIYLSPFSDVEITRYIRKRYPLWKPALRHEAAKVISRAPNLIVRPMLLTHVEHLLKNQRTVRCAAELYEEMVEAWLAREEGLARSRSDLRQFSERLAEDIYINREKRGTERVSKLEIESLAQDWGIAIETWALTGRSLLNRDAEGNYKFSHRSIMEYLLARLLIEERRAIARELKLTDQMQIFLSEAIIYGLDIFYRSYNIPHNLRPITWNIKQFQWDKFSIQEHAFGVAATAFIYLHVFSPSALSGSIVVYLPAELSYLRVESLSSVARSVLAHLKADKKLAYRNPEVRYCSVVRLENSKYACCMVKNKTELKQFFPSIEEFEVVSFEHE